MQPQIFLRMRADLASMWSHPNRTGNAKKIYGKSSSRLHQRMKSVTAENEEPSETDEENICMKVKTFRNLVSSLFMKLVIDALQ